MEEIKRIRVYNNRELPKGSYFIIRVEDIPNSKGVLEKFKKSMIAILENRDLSYDDKKWYDIIPKDIVDTTTKFDDEDYKNDDLLSNIEMMIYGMFYKKDWEFYSTKLYKDGLEIIFSGDSRGVGPLNFIRFQKPGIPLSKITKERDGIVYPIKVYKDVMSYRSF